MLIRKNGNKLYNFVNTLLGYKPEPIIFLNYRFKQHFLSVTYLKPLSNLYRISDYQIDIRLLS